MGRCKYYTQGGKKYKIRDPDQVSKPKHEDLKKFSEMMKGRKLTPVGGVKRKTQVITDDKKT